MMGLPLLGLATEAPGHDAPRRPRSWTTLRWLRFDSPDQHGRYTAEKRPRCVQIEGLRLGYLRFRVRS